MNTTSPRLIALLLFQIGRAPVPWIYLPGMLGEASLTLWLLLIGVNVQRWNAAAEAA